LTMPGASTLNGGALNMPGCTIAVLRDILREGDVKTGMFLTVGRRAMIRCQGFASLGLSMAAGSKLLIF
jgi:hypothetical protein